MDVSIQKQLTGFLDTWLAVLARRDNLPGISLAIRDRQGLLYQASLDSAGKRPAHELYNMGSQAKMMTAVLVLRLAQENMLNLKDPAVLYVPWLAKHADKRFGRITVEELLWHGAGLVRDGHDADYWQLLRPFPDVNELQRMVLASSLVFEPGYKLKYSNIGYALLGRIIETAAQMPYKTCAETYIIRPLGLKHTCVGLPEKRTLKIAPGYAARYMGTYKQLADNVPTNTLVPATGWYAAPADMAAIVSALTSKSCPLLEKAWQAALLGGNRSHWMPLEQRGSEYGFGMMSMEIGAHTVIGHGGSYVTHRSATFSDPANGLTVAVAAANRDAPVTDILFGTFETLHYVLQHGKNAITRNQAAFSGPYHNVLITKYLLAVGSHFACVYLDDLAPFGNVDELRQVAKKTLQITDTFDLMAEGEYVRFSFDAAAVASMSYAGTTMWPGLHGSRKNFDSFDA